MYMLRILKYFLIGSLITRCNTEADKIESFISGTYVRFSDHEMRIEYDTLSITPTSEEANSYIIIKTSSFQRKLDGKTLPVEHSKEEYTAVYDPSKKVMNEITKGRIVTFDPNNRLLTFGTSQYRKIK
jgi:hypothetical protein